MKSVVRWVLQSALLIVILLALLVLVFMLTRPRVVVDATDPVGLMAPSFYDAARQRQLDAYIWYPTDVDNAATEEVEMLEDNLLFHGFPAILNAAPLNGRFPLVLLSHGSGGNRGNQGWLATELARQGALVVAINHPGSTSRDSAPATNILAWNRPLDMSFLLGTLLQDSRWADSIDPDRIAVIGHSLGGYTALALGGGRLSLTEFIAYCDSHSAAPDCRFYRNGNVNLGKVDPILFEASYRDSRLNAVIALDPAYAKAFQQRSLVDSAPALLLAPATEKNTVDDLQADYLAGQMAERVDFKKLQGANHFTFLPRCKPFAGLVMGLIEKGAEVLCQAEQHHDRATFQKASILAVTEFLQARGILDK